MAERIFPKFLHQLLGFVLQHKHVLIGKSDGSGAEARQIVLGDINNWQNMTETLTNTHDVVIDDSSKGWVGKSQNGHYWRLTVSDTGVLSTTDLGTTPP